LTTKEPACAVGEPLKWVI